MHGHVAPSIGSFATPDVRDDHVHIDIFGPLTPSLGHTHLLACIGRFTIWPEAIPISTATVESMSRYFVERWIVLYGCLLARLAEGNNLSLVYFLSLPVRWVRSGSARPLITRHRTFSSPTQSGSNLKNLDWCETSLLVLFGIRT